MRMLVEAISNNGQRIELLNGPLQINTRQLERLQMDDLLHCEPASNCISSQVARYDWERKYGGCHHGGICVESTIKCTDPSDALINRVRQKVHCEQRMRTAAATKIKKLEKKLPIHPPGKYGFITAREMLSRQTEEADIQRHNRSVRSETECETDAAVP